MAKAPRRKRNPTVMINLGSGGKIISFAGQTFNVSNGDDASLTQAAGNISAVCGIS